MSSDEEEEGIRSRIDRFFDGQARKRDELLDREAMGKRFEEVKRSIAISSPKSVKRLARKRRERSAAPEAEPVPEASLPEVEIGPWSRGLVRITTAQPPLTLGIMTVIMLIMLVGIGHTNVNGAMEVYLPRGSPEEALLFEVREDWSTDIIVIYVETRNAYEMSDKTNITERRVLLEMDFIERKLDFIGQIEEPGQPGVVPSDSGEIDNIVFSLSISTIIKELHSSNSRVYDALINNADDWAAAETDDLSRDAAQLAKQLAQAAKQLAVATGTLGSYEIPSQSDIDGYTDDIPQSVLSKVIRDTNGDGIWDTGVMVFGITSTVDPAIAIDDVQEAIDVRGAELPNRPNGETYSYMALTGPVPVTQAITERSFQEFWNVFPIGVVLCAVMIFALHKRIRAVLIAGVPTLYGIFFTYGVIGGAPMRGSA